MREKYFDNLKYCYLSIAILFYFYGFFQRENIAGGAEQDFLKFTWPLIISFKDNFFYTLKNYGSFGEGSFPLFHILNAYLNPFTFDKFYFQGSITIISFLNFIILAQVIKKNFKIPLIDSLIFSSALLFLPFFRSSAYWGITENFGWLFLILSINFYFDYNNNKKDKTSKLKIFLVCLFSSLALYTRPYLVFFPIFIMIYSMFKKDVLFLKYGSIIYFFFSLPVFYLLFLWGGIFYELGDNKTSLIADYHNPKFIFKNLIIFSTILFFYLFPLKLSEKFSNLFNIDKKTVIYFLALFCLFISLDFLGVFNYLSNTTLGGGVILKINQIFFNNFIMFFSVSAIGFLIIKDYFFFSTKNIILLFSLLIFCFPKHIFQEYYEPLILILFFTILDLNDNKIKNLKKSKTLIIFILYFVFYYFGSFFYRKFI